MLVSNRKNIIKFIYIKQTISVLTKKNGFYFKSVLGNVELYIGSLNINKIENIEMTNNKRLFLLVQLVLKTL